MPEMRIRECRLPKPRPDKRYTTAEVRSRSNGGIGKKAKGKAPAARAPRPCERVLRVAECISHQHFLLDNQPTQIMCATSRRMRRLSTVLRGAVGCSTAHGVALRGVHEHVDAHESARGFSYTLHVRDTRLAEHSNTKQTYVVRGHGRAPSASLSLPQPAVNSLPAAASGSTRPCCAAPCPGYTGALPRASPRPAS